MTITRRGFVGAAGATLLAKSQVRVGCQTNAWRIDPKNFDSLLGVLDKLQKYGYQGYETGYRNVEGRFDRIAETRAALEKRGMEFLGCHIFLLQYDPSTLIAPADLIDRVVDGAAKLGAKRLILSGAAAKQDKAALRRKAAALNAVGKKCKAKKLQLAYHNHDLEFLHKAEEMEEMLRLTDGETVHLMMDAGHAFHAGANIVQFFEQHSARIDGLHLRDFVKDEQVPLGQGTFDLKPLAEAIRRKRWTGWVINEEERLNDVKPGDTAVAPARQHLRKVFGV
jgi:sugar phosphate isomerase/epimerase